MDRGAQWATVHGITKESETTEQLKNSNNNLKVIKNTDEKSAANIIPNGKRLKAFPVRSGTRQ